MTPNNVASSPAHVAVIGGGLGGLICATQLADFGTRVTIFESAQVLGGRARTMETGGGQINFGPHALYCAGRLQGILDEWGLSPSGAAVQGGHGSIGEQIYRLPSGPWTFLTTGLLPGRTRLQFLGALRAILKAEPEQCHKVSARDWIERHIEAGRPAKVVGALTRLATYCAALDALPAAVMLAQLQMAMKGVRYVDAGWQTMVDALVERARARGASVRKSDPVRRVEPHERGVRLHTRSESVEVDAVALAVGPRAVQRILPEHLIERAGLDFEPRPVQAACLDLVLEDWSHTKRPVIIGVDSPTYVSNHSHYAELSGAGRHVVHAARYLRPGEELSAQESRDEIEEALTLVEPKWRERVVEARFLPEMNVIEHLPALGAGRRDELTVGGRDDIVLVGDWVGGQGWLADAVAASATQAAAHLRNRVVRRAHGS